jgi:hypothetical protein
MVGVQSAEKMDTPPESMPELCIAVALDGHTVEVRRFVERTVTRTGTTSSAEGAKWDVKVGSIEPSSKHEAGPLLEMQAMRFDVEKLKARQVDGRVVTEKNLIGLLTKPTAIIVEKNGGQLNPLLATVFKPDAVILLLPKPTTIAPPH